MNDMHTLPHLHPAPDTGAIEAPGKDRTPRLHRTLLSSCLILLLILMGAPLFAADTPNILFILADDMGYGDVGCYGQQDILTPRLDRMASEGIRYTDAYAGSAICAPSRCTLMTGQHTGHATIRGNTPYPEFSSLKDEDLTVAEVLKAAGYTTGIIGKWGLGDPDTPGIPNSQGFDYFYGYLNHYHAHDYYTEYLWENDIPVVLEGNLDGKEEEYTHDLFTEKAKRFIEDNQAGPFFLYLAYTIPHADTGSGTNPVPSQDPYGDMPWPEEQKNVAAMLTRMDEDVGDILDLVDALGIGEETIVFFSSDNGPHQEGGYNPYFFNSNGPLRGIKRSTHEGGIRVPMIVRWPSHLEPGRVSDHPWAFWDFLPTAADLAGLPAPDGIDGISITPDLMGDPQPEEGPLYWEFQEWTFYQAVRMGPWKGLRQNVGPLELYNLDANPAEIVNVADSHPDIVFAIEDIMLNERSPSSRWPSSIDYPGLLGHWTFDVDASDSVGNNHGTLQGGAHIVPDGKLGGAVELDGVDDYVELPFILNPAASAFTVSCWIYLESVSGVLSQTILQQTGPNGRPWLYRNSVNGKLGTLLGGLELRSETAIPPGEWVHVAVVKSNVDVRLYVNGRLEAFQGRNIQWATGNLQVGMHKDPSIAYAGWKGKIDDLRIYNYTVTGGLIGDGCFDNDGDGYGNPVGPLCAYMVEDCDDANADVNPGMPEIPGNGIDDDCTETTPNWGTPASTIPAQHAGLSNPANHLLYLFGSALCMFFWKRRRT